MMDEILDISVLNDVPAPAFSNALPEIKSLLDQHHYKVVVLDDDPTGCQTVHDVPILTSWSYAEVEVVLKSPAGCIFILTNTRSMVEEKAVDLTRQVVEVVKAASSHLNLNIIIISRSDSTLRGHYPAELEAITETLANEKSMQCLLPAFFQGGRYTLNNTHYVKEGSQLIPAHLTAFAQDKSFGFKHSKLPLYVEEKTKGLVSQKQVLSISLEDLRKGGPDHVEMKLMDSQESVCIVNAVDQNDLDIFALAAWKVILKGKKLAFRTAASFLNSFCAIETKPLLTREDILHNSKMGALFIVGSYVPKSSDQLNHLLEHTDIKGYEVPVEELVSDNNISWKDTITRNITNDLQQGTHIVVYTSRKLVTGQNQAENLLIGQQISNFLVELTDKCYHLSPPSFLLTKGGITSHVIARDALKITKANVKGQILAGVPVWEFSQNQKNQLSSLIIFPGNVGEESSLTKIYQQLTNYA